MAVSISLSITQNSQNVANNTSNITVKVNCKCTYGSWSGLSKSGSLTIDGTSYSFSSTFNTGGATNWSGTLFTKTVNVSHNSNGTKTVSCSAWFDTKVSSGKVTATNSKTLTTIPRKSSLSVANGTLGTAQTLTISRASSSFTHTITAKCGSSYVTVVSGTSSTSISFTPPLTWASQNTSGTSVSVTYTLTTTGIGSNSYTNTCTIPSSVKPSCSITVSDPTGYATKYGGYVYRKSKISVSVSASTSYGSSIREYSVSANGRSYTSSSITTEAITSRAASQSITASVTDYRGRSGSTSKSITVLDYYSPTATISVDRCDSDGTANNQGSYCKVTYSSSFTSLGGKNSAAYKLGYKSTMSTDFTVVDISSVSGSYIFAANMDSSYNVTFTVTDDFETISNTVILSAAFALMHWKASGTGIGLGKLSEHDNTIDVGMPIQLDNNQSIYGTDITGNRRELINYDTVNDMTVGRGGYIAGLGGTWIYGNNMHVYATNKMRIHSDIVLDNECIIYLEDPSGNARNVLWSNATAEVGYGYDSRQYSQGSVYYDGHWINIRSNNAVQVDAPTGFYINGNRHDVNKVLWSGATYMFGSQTAVLSDSISNQPHGIVLVINYYDGGTTNTNWHEFFISKQAVSYAPGAGFGVRGCTNTGNTWFNKYLYVSNTQIKGNDVNDDASKTTSANIILDNNKFVLRYVIGV